MAKINLPVSGVRCRVQAVTPLITAIGDSIKNDLDGSSEMVDSIGDATGTILVSAG